MSATEGLRASVDARNREAWDLMRSDPDAALSLSERALAEAEEAGYAAGAAEARLGLGWCECYLSRLAPAILSFQAALEGFEALADPVGIMKALNALGATYHDLDRYDRAMDYYTRSLEEARRRGNHPREAASLNNIGEVCLALGEHKEALDYFLRAYEIAPDDGDPEMASSVLLNIGQTFLRMDNWMLAREFTEKALAIAESANDRLIAAECLLAFARVHASSGRPELAESYGLRALALSEEIRNERLRIQVLIELGSLHASEGAPARALQRFRDALHGAEAIGAKALVHEAYAGLANAHEELGDWKTALAYVRRHARYEREILKEDAARKIKNVAVQYEVEKSRQEAEIFRLRNIELRDKTAALEEANSFMLEIADIGRRITSSLDLDAVIKTLYESLGRSMDVTLFGVATHAPEEKSLDWISLIERKRRVHRSVQRLDQARSLGAWCVANRQPIFMVDAVNEYRRYLTGEPTSSGKLTQSIMFHPLVIDDRVIGVITVQSYEKDAYEDRHRLLLEALAPYVAIAVENGTIHDRLAELNRSIMGEKDELREAASRSSHLANHDSLTGLPNRRLLFELLQKSFDLAARNQTRVGVVYVDLDNFKPINDRFGHAAGDRALVSIAERLRGILRSSDTVARLGGDEFVAVLTNAHGREDIEPVARKILEECSRPMDFSGTEASVSLSVGIAIYPDDGGTIEDLVNRADQAMYRIKHAEKNGIAFASDSPNLVSP